MSSYYLVSGIPTPFFIFYYSSFEVCINAKILKKCFNYRFSFIWATFSQKTFQCHSFDHNYWKKVFYSISSHWYYHCTFYLTSAVFPGWYYSFAFKVLLGAGECMPFLPRNCLARMMVFYAFHIRSVLFEQLYKVLLLVQATCF